MADNPQEAVWAEAVKMARTGQFKGAADVVEKLRAAGYGSELDAWPERPDYGDLEQMCRDASKARRDDPAPDEPGS